MVHWAVNIQRQGSGLMQESARSLETCRVYGNYKISLQFII